MGAALVMYLNMRVHAQEIETQELAEEKKSGCMWYRIILHRGCSGTYLSQQGEAVEGWGLEALAWSGAQSGTGTPKMDERGMGGLNERRWIREWVRAGAEERRGSPGGRGKRRWAMAGWSFFWSIIEWCAIQCVDWGHLGDSEGGCVFVY